MKNPTLKNVLVCLAATAGLVSLASVFAAPLVDSDIWWHLATGRYLTQTGHFLSADPFGLAGAQITPGREIVLNSYWLSQFLFYSIQQLFGLAGIVALRVGLLLTPPLAVLIYSWRRTPFSAAGLFMALLCGWAMINVSGIRPTHLTVAFVPLLFILLTEIGFAAEWQAGEGYNLRKAWLLPLFILLWANLHGGFLLGVAIIVVYALSETITLQFRKQSLRLTFQLWLVVVVTLLASLLTPNGILVFIQYLSFQGGVIQQKTSEYLSPLVLAQNGILIYWPYFIFLLLSVLVLFACRFRVPLTRWVLLFVLAVLGLTAFRYAPLFVGAAAILLFPELNRFAVNFQPGRLLLNLLNAALACFLLFTAVTGYPQSGGALSQGLVDQGRFPVAAVDFIKHKKLSGTVFNHFNWGGYLAWQLPGRVTTFIDGRSLNLPLFHEYTRTLWVPDEMPSILDRRGVDLIVMPRLNPFTGELYALTDYLWHENGWGLVYRDRTAMVLVRQDQFPVLKRLNKNLIYQDVLRDIEAFGSATSGNLALDKIATFARRRLTIGSTGSP